MKHEFYNPHIENAAGYFLSIVNSVLNRTQMALVCVRVVCVVCVWVCCVCGVFVECMCIWCVLVCVCVMSVRVVCSVCVMCVLFG